MKTDRELVNDCLELADIFYQMFGNISRPGFKYFNSRHPQEKLVWAMAVYAYDHIKATDIEDILVGMDEE